MTICVGLNMIASNPRMLAHDVEKCEAVFRKSLPSDLTRGIMRKQQPEARW
jgi:hypothetical protein